MKKLDYLIIGALFYIGWFGSIFISRTAFSNLSVLFPIILVGFIIYKQSLNLKAGLWSLLISFVGITFDSILNYFNYISFTEKTEFIIPLWLISIWLLFSFSMIKLGIHFKISIWLSSLLGLIMGPLSYKSGEYFQVLQFTYSSTYIIYAIYWGLTFPLILNLSKRSA